MQISISTRHGHLGEATQENIRGKVSKLARMNERLTSIEVTVDLGNADEPSIELLVAEEHKHDFVATAHGTELIGAVEAAVHKVEQQLRKYKEKVIDRHRSGPTRPEAEEI